jgi:excisionase family DNA binding protein
VTWDDAEILKNAEYWFALSPEAQAKRLHRRAALLRVPLPDRRLKVNRPVPEVVPVMESTLLTIAEAMAYLKVSRQTIYHWRKDGRVRVVRTPSGAPRIERASLLSVPTSTTR